MPEKLLKLLIYGIKSCLFFGRKEKLQEKIQQFLACFSQIFKMASKVCSKERFVTVLVH